MALAKLGLPSKVCSVYPMLTISETVYYEVVTSGLAIGAKDAAEVDKFNQIVIFPSNEIKEVSLDMLSELHKGEIETIKIALQLSADYLLIDDFDARQVADANLQKMSAATTLKGTLGILVELYKKKLISKSQLKEHIEEIKRRRDIWISARLCQKLIEALEAGFL
jgi:predicted nucleic acid-binding protein